MALWIELNWVFDDAVEAGDFKIADAIFQYAKWSYSPESGKLPNDTSTAAIISFIEHLPTHPAIVQNLSRWLGHAEFKCLKGNMAYLVGPKRIEEIEDHVYGAK